MPHIADVKMHNKRTVSVKLLAKKNAPIIWSVFLFLDLVHAGPALRISSLTPSANCLKFSLKRSARCVAFASYWVGFGQVLRGDRMLPVTSGQVLGTFSPNKGSVSYSTSVSNPS